MNEIKLKLLLLIAIIAIPILAKAQNSPCSFSINGKVLDANTNQPIPFAVIKVDNADKYATADEKGYFNIDGLCQQKNTVVVSSLGYINLTTAYDKIAGQLFLSPDVTGLDEVTIQAEKAKEKGTETIAQITISKADIVSNPTQTLAASLSKVEGVTFASTGTNVQLPVIHGLSGNRILILNNGLKHGFQNWGTEHAPEIDINGANNITIIKGAAGVRFGPEALSGAVLVEPNPLLLNNPFYGTAGIGYQTNGRGYNANVAIGQGTEKWSYFANGSYTKIGDRNTPDYNLSNTGKEESAFAIGARHSHKDWDFRIYYSLIDQDLGLLRASFVESAPALIRAFNADEPDFTDPFTYTIREPNHLTQHHLAKAEVDWKYADEGKLNFRVGVQLNKRQEFDVRRNEEFPIIDLDLLTYDYQLEWEHPTWKGLDGFIGVQYFEQNNDNNPGTFNAPFIPNYNASRFSGFIIEKISLGEDTFEVGIRLDTETNDVRGRDNTQAIFRDRYTFTNFTTSLGYQWQFSQNSNLKTNIGSAFRTPNVAELFSFGRHGSRSIFGLLRSGFNDDGTLNTSQVALLDDSSVELERGYKLTNEFRTYNNNNTHIVTTYANYIDNFVYYRPVGVSRSFAGANPTFYYDQADALFLGLDYTWKKEFSDDLSTTYGLSYLWSRNIGEDEPLINIAPISTNLELKWNQGKMWFFDSSKWTLRPSYTFEQFQAPRTVALENLVDGSTIITPESEIFDFLDAPDGYFLLDASWDFKWKKIGGSITAQNILNTRYRNYLNEFRYFADEPGLNLLLTLNYQF